MNELIKLISETVVVDEYGDRIITKSERTIFCEVRSIRQSEFYQAEAVGLKPEISFKIADFLDYQGEEVVLYKPFLAEEWIEYKVIRTYRADNSLEIYCSRGIER